MRKEKENSILHEHVVREMTEMSQSGEYCREMRDNGPRNYTTFDYIAIGVIGLRQLVVNILHDWLNSLDGSGGDYCMTGIQLTQIDIYEEKMVDADQYVERYLAELIRILEPIAEVSVANLSAKSIVPGLGTNNTERSIVTDGSIQKPRVNVCSATNKNESYLKETLSKMLQISTRSPGFFITGNHPTLRKIYLPNRAILAQNGLERLVGDGRRR